MKEYLNERKDDGMTKLGYSIKYAMIRNKVSQFLLTEPSIFADFFCGYL